MSQFAVSVLLPSRHRPVLLRKAIASLAATAKYPERVEVLVAADPDDGETRISDDVLLRAVRVLTAPQRWGRGSIHEYYNWLARHATGDWLLLFNDDATMLTQDWDEIIAGQEPCIALVGSNHGDHMFMAVPSAWARAAGYLSALPDIDNFLYAVGERLGCNRHVPVRVFHDMYRVTGNNGDDTYWEGREDSQRVAEAGWDVLFGDGEQAMRHMTEAIQGLAEAPCRT